MKCASRSGASLAIHCVRYIFSRCRPYSVYRQNTVSVWTPKIWKKSLLLPVDVFEKNKKKQKKTAGWVVSSVHPEQMRLSAASDLGLHCLLGVSSQNTYGIHDSGNVWCSMWERAIKPSALNEDQHQLAHAHDPNTAVIGSQNHSIFNDIPANSEGLDLTAHSRSQI